MVKHLEILIAQKDELERYPLKASARRPINYLYDNRRFE
jgi:hypothetical protein